MAELLKLLLSLPISMVLVIIGALMACALLFEEYFGFKPLKKTRWMTGFLGLFLLVSGVILVILGTAQRIKSTSEPAKPTVEKRKLQEKEISSLASDVSIPKVATELNPKPHKKSGTESIKNVQDLNICEKYKNYTEESWRKKFLRETQLGTWHVFVASLEPSQTEEEAKQLAYQYRIKFPNHDFRIMPTIHNLQEENFRYAIVIAEGLTNRTIAKEIARYANECGIAKDAFPFQQKF